MTMHLAESQCTIKEARRFARLGKVGGDLKVGDENVDRPSREGGTGQLKLSQYTVDSGGRAQPTSFLHSGGCVRGCRT